MVSGKEIMNTAEFFKKYIEAYERVTKALSVYGDLLDIHLQVLKGKARVLESGSGPGHLVIALLQTGAEVYAVDQNQAALDRIKEKSKEYADKIKTFCRDAQNLPFDDEFFDGVSSMSVLPFIDDPIQYLKEHKRVLKKEGIIVISGPTEEIKSKIDWLLDKWAEDLKNQGVWDTVKDDWELIERYTRENVELNVKNWFSSDELRRILVEEIDLQIISEDTNPMYYGMGYVFVTKK